MRSKKNESVSNLEERTVHVIGKGPLVTLVVPVSPAIPSTETMRMASPATLVEEITTPILKRPCLTNKGKEKADSHPPNVWDDARLAVERAHKVVTTKDLKVFLGMPSNEVVARHVCKIVQGVYS